MRPRLLSLLLAVATADPARAVMIPVAPGASVQAAIVAAAPGDVVQLAAGTYDGDIDYLGKAITVVGVGPDTVLRGTGTAPVVTFAAAEPAEAVLDSVTVTGGLAEFGGGIRVFGASPTIQRTVIVDNRAVFRGSGILLQDSNARVFNNLILYSTTAGGDPHSIDVTGGGPMIVNNTIVRGDSNAIIIRLASTALVMNNILAANGSATASERRGRGICDFSSGGSARILYNVFHRNRVGALLTDGRDFRAIRHAQRRIGAPRLVGNVDGRPGFVERIARTAANTAPSHFMLTGRGRATDAGNPDPAFADPDGTRNDAGAGGGPLAPAWLAAD